MIFTAACAVPVDSLSEDVDEEYQEHDSLVEVPDDEPLPGLAEDTDFEGLDYGTLLDEGTDEPVEEAPYTISGGTCVNGGAYCGGDKVSGDKNTLYRCHGAGNTPTVIQHCSAGCSVNPGKDDSCAKPAGTCSITKVPHAAYLKSGLHPDASDALRFLKFTAARVTQTIGSASASAGTHAKDGVAGGHSYSAATDLSVKGMSDAQVKVLLTQLTKVGFVAYYRSPGHDGWPSSEARHIHAIWAGAKMKLSLRNQVRDWHVGKNALASHTKYTFYTWTKCWHDSIWKRFDSVNSATN